MSKKTEDKLDKIIKLLEEIKAKTPDPIPFYYYQPWPQPYIPALLPDPYQPQWTYTCDQPTRHTSGGDIYQC